MIHIEDYINWVDNEYNLWKLSLLDCISDTEKFADFKNQSQVKRMLGVSDLFLPFLEKLKNENIPWDKVEHLDQIGNPSNTVEVDKYKISGIGLRYVYYANKILNNIPSLTNLKIVEIGGGYGGLATMIHLLAKERKIKIKEYGVFDLPEVQSFQKHYFTQTISPTTRGNGIQKITFLDSSNLENFSEDYSYCVSCYALGEFATPVKHSYINNIVSKIKHGFILWNPHQNKDVVGEELLKKYHSNLEISAEDPPTGFYNLEIKY